MNVGESDRAYIIKSFQKSVNDIKIKNIYNNIIFKIIHNTII